MLDRMQHLRLFLTGIGCDEIVVEIVVSDPEVKKQLDKHPVDVDNLLTTISRSYQLSAVNRQQFKYVFERYRSN
jgi:hypothetical protein